MQTSLNPGLAQVIGAMNAINPVTPEGTPTVAAKVMQAAQGATTPQVAQQAGLGGQIQAMKMQEAQKALMQQAMAQRPPAGIEGLNPQMSNFAEGGIVGYSTAGEAQDKAPSAQTRSSINPIAYLLDKLFSGGLPTRGGVTATRQPAIDAADTEKALEIIAASAPMMDIPEVKIDDTAAKQAALANLMRPTAPGRVYGTESPSAGMFNAARARLGQQAMEPVSPEQGVEGALALGRAQDELRRRMGLPPEMERITKEGEEFSKLYGERGQRLAERISQLESERGQQGIISFLTGARGMRGQGAGEVFRTGTESARAYEEATRGRIEKMQDLQLEVRGLELEKRTALAKMKDDIANGRFKDAMANKQKAQDAQNNLLKAYAEIDLAQGKALSEEAKARMMATPQASETERAMAEYFRLLKIDPAAAQKYLETRALISGGGRGAQAAERQDLAELKALQTSLNEQLKRTYGKAEREALMQQLNAVNARIGQMAGITTSGAGAAPGVDYSQFKVSKEPK